MSVLDDILKEQNEKNESGLVRRVIGDSAVSAAKGITGVGQAAVGLADIPTMGYAGKAMEDIAGYDAQRTNQFLEDLYSPEQQAANQAVSNANGFYDTLGAVVANPSTIPHKIIESAPMMLGGQAIASGLLKTGLITRPLAAAAIGEGAVTAGSQAEAIREQNPDRTLTPTQAAIAAGSGAVTGLVTGGSGVIANRFGADIDRLFLDGQTAQGAKNPFIRALGGGATEGTEELIQSAQEQAATNIATGQPIEQGVGNAAAVGMMTGFGQGAPTAALFGGNTETQATQDNQALPQPEVTPQVQAQAEPQGALSRAVQQSVQSSGQVDVSQFANAQANRNAFIRNLQGTQSTPVLPNLPADEILIFNDGSQARSSEIKQQLMNDGHTESDADLIVSNLKTAQANRDTQTRQNQQAEQQKSEASLNQYRAVLSGNQQNQAIAEGLKTDFEQKILPQFQAQQAEQERVKQAEIQAKNERLAKRQVQDVVFNDSNEPFTTPQQAKRYAAQNGLHKTHTARKFYDGSWALARNDFSGEFSPFTENTYRQAAQGQTTTNPTPTNDQSQNQTAQEITATQSVTAQPAQQKPKQAAIKEDDDLLTAIAKLGGLNRDEATAQGIDNKAMNQRAKVFGSSNVFSKQGRSYDDLTETLQGHGYDITDANDLVDKVSRAVNQGEKIYTPRGYELEAERKLAQEAEDRFYREEETQETSSEQPTQEATNETLQRVETQTFTAAKTDSTKNEINGQQKTSSPYSIQMASESKAQKSGDSVTPQATYDDYDDSIPFSKSEPTKNAHSKQSLIQGIQKALDDKFGNGFFNRLIATGKFKVASSAEVKAMGIDDNAQAFYNPNPKDDTTYFVYDNIDKRTDLFKLALHEIGVHALQMGKNSKQFQDILAQVERMTKQPTKFMKAAVQAAKNANTPAHLMNEEILGYLVENHPNLSIVQKFKAWFRAMLRKLGFNRPLNDQDLVYMATSALRNAPSDLLFDDVARKDDTIRLARKEGYKGTDIGEAEEWIRAVEKGLDMSFEARMERAKVMGFDVDTIYYHGTNDDFNSFNSIYGGIYFSQSPDISSTYHDRLVGTGGVDKFLLRKGNHADLTDQQEQTASEYLDWYFDEEKDHYGYDSMSEMVKDGMLIEMGRDFQNKVMDVLSSKFDSVTYNDYQSGDPEIDISTVIFNPNNIRSIDAAFDPDYADSPNLLASYAGQKAKNADKSALARAVEMEQQGIDNETIRKETGWFLGMDDKWRFEIDDSQFSINQQTIEKMRDYGRELATITKSKPDVTLYGFSELEKLINHPELFKQYPFLKELMVMFKDSNSEGASISSTGLITINARLDKNDLPIFDKSGILHEIQHAIQNYEGFATGTTIQTASERLVEIKKANQDYYDTVLSKEPYQNVIARINKAYDENDIDKIKKLEPYAKQIEQIYSKGIDLVKAINEAYLSPEEKYIRSAGEIEARDTQARMGMTAKQRRENTPYVSQGIPKEDAIVRFGSGVAESRTFDTSKEIRDEQGKLLAPNGKSSNLNQMQWHQVRTSEFKAWFGDWINDPENASKAVDENGEPLVVYHTGTWSEGIAKTDGFHFGMHFGTKATSEIFARNNTATTPVFLNLKNPFRSKDISFGTSEQTIEEFYDMGILDDAEFKKANEIYMSQFGDFDNWEEIQRNVEKDIGDLFKRAFNRHGHDGIVYKNDYEDAGNDSYIAFNANQVKSATANTGAFSKDNDDIRYSKRPQTLNDMQDLLNTGKLPDDKRGWQYWLDKAVTNFVDSTRPFERFIAETFNDLQASRLIGAADRASGMKATYEQQAMNRFGKTIAEGIKAIADKTGMNYDAAKEAAGMWMTARYAPIANDWLMQKDQQAIDDLEQEKADLITNYNGIKNPSQSTTDKYFKKIDALDKQIKKAKDQQAKRIAAINNLNIINITEQPSDAGLAGGLNNATAKEFMREIEAKIPVNLLQDLAENIYDMNAWKLSRDIQDGKISQETADKFPKSRFYVPLTGDPRAELDDSKEDGFMTGGVNQAKDKGLGGRTSSLAQNGIDASFEQLEKSARYHGWNEFKDELTKVYEDLLADKLAQGLNQKDAEKAVLDEYSISRRTETGHIPAGDNDIVVRKDGKGMIYTLHNQAAMEALRSVNNEDMPSVLKPIAFLTRLQARMVTQFMPLFAPTNALRDTLERSENIRARKIAGYNALDMNSVANQAIGRAGKNLFNLRKTMMAVLAEGTPLAKLFPIDNTNTDTQQLKRFLELGGSSTYGDYLSTNSKALADKLQKSIRLDTKAMETIHLYNNAFELISGFSIYQSLINHGVDEQNAATASLNLMNFRKRGRIMSPIRALYMFAQPIATGGQQLGKTLMTQQGRRRFAAYTIASAFLYAILRSGEDDKDLGVNKMDEAGNFTLYRNILIPLGDGRYAKVPIGFGLQQLAWAQGVNLVRTSLGNMTVPEAIAESTAIGTKSVMPIAPSETSIAKNPMIWLAQTFTPQIAKPVANVAMDVNSFGAPLTNSRYEREDKAKALQGRRDTPTEYKRIAQELARHGIDVYPEQIREFSRDWLAGVGNEALKFLIENPAKQQRGLQTISPAIDRLILQTNDDSLKQRLYYRKRDLMNDLAIKDSLGNPLTPAEKTLVELNNQLKTREARARGYLAQATKAENTGATIKAKNLRNRYEKTRQAYINYALGFDR